MLRWPIAPSLADPDADLGEGVSRGSMTVDGGVAC